MNKEYKLSGKAGNLWLVGVLLGPTLAILLSIIYSYIDVYNPFIYLTIIVYIGYLFWYCFNTEISDSNCKM